MTTSDNDTPNQRCYKCGNTYPATREYYPWNKKKDQPRLECHECNRARMRAWQAANRERDNQRAKEYRQVNRERLNEYDRKRYAENREQRLIQDKARYAADPEKHRARHRARYASDSGYYKRRSKAYRLANPDRVKRMKITWMENSREHRRKKSAEWRNANIEKVREISRNWSARHPLRVKANSERQRSRRAMADGQFTAQDIEAIYTDQDGRCAYCGITVHDDFHLDHMHPIAQGGTNWPENIAVSCAPCNLSKGSKTIAEWESVRGW